MSKVWLIFRRGDNPARTQIASGVDLLVVKKDRSNGSYVTNDLSKNLLPQFAKDASPTILNSGSVLSIRHLAQSPAIVQASVVGAISLCVWLPHYHAPRGVGNYRGS